jgi:hypothetical protein
VNKILETALTAATVGAIFLGGSLYLKYRDGQVVKRADDKQEVAAFDSTREVQADTVKARDVARFYDVPRYRDVARRVVADNPASAPVREIKAAADKAIESDSASIAARDALLDTQAREIGKLKAMKSMSPPRISLYGSGGYDFIQKEPVSKIGTEIRIFEPLSVNAYLEARTRMLPDSTGGKTARVNFSGVVEAKISFR